MSSAVIFEDFKNNKKADYISFVEHLGSCICFSDDKWICDTFLRAPTETPSRITLYFSKIPEHYRDMVKYFSAIRLIQGKAIGTVILDTQDLTRFFGFWNLHYKTAGLHLCDEFIAAKFYQYLVNRGWAEASNSRTWRSVSIFFSTMGEWDGRHLKNPFLICPFREQKKFDYMYIPENVALQLDNVFKMEDIALHLRCAYWILRLIPSRISEVVGIRIDCLKRYNGHYVLFIPTWKQNGGWREPIMRSIHLEETGIAGYLIDLIKKQQNKARRLQKHMADNKKGALLTYQQTLERRGKLPVYTREYSVLAVYGVRKAFKDICEKYNVTDNDGHVYKVTTHQFRHNGITDRLAAGFTAAQIAEMTGHHGNAMIFNSYNHLNLQPERIIEKQEYISQESHSRDNQYILFGGRILNMEEHLEKRLLRNLRAHKVRGGICSDITGCKSDMWDCLDCEFFIPDAEQVDYYKEQAALWQEKSVRFSSLPIIKGNAEKNAELYERVLSRLNGGEYKS